MCVHKGDDRSLFTKFQVMCLHASSRFVTIFVYIHKYINQPARRGEIITVFINFLFYYKDERMYRYLYDICVYVYSTEL